MLLELYFIVVRLLNSKESEEKMFPPGLEPGTFRVLGERDNHYTTETCFNGFKNAYYSRAPTFLPIHFLALSLLLRSCFVYKRRSTTQYLSIVQKNFMVFMLERFFRLHSRLNSLLRFWQSQKV